MEDIELRIPEMGERMKFLVVKPSEMLRIRLKAEEIEGEKLTVRVVKV